ncbi:SDR family NAD(P)-dependent oxidoreductase [Glaciibacter sp. 2TAF33]|uniref:SDR family NAD(P)-dependent oxidoreductase n=1 Tax=Glaciibacter sp. 2TAF33 TaxID=3233015 RepID=UPI003F90ED57
MSDSTNGFDFTGKVIAITGAGRGIGAAYARDLARRGAAVVVNDMGRDEDGESRAGKAVLKIVNAGGSAVADESDVADPEGAGRLVDTAVTEFGRLDGLIHNAGFLRPSRIADMAPNQIDEVLGVHVRAAFHTTIAAWPHLVAAGDGRIVYTGSSGMFGHDANSNYSAAKSSIFGLTRSIAAEGAPNGIRVNCVMPYAQSLMASDNPLIPSERQAASRAALNILTDRRAPDSMAPLVTYLMSDACSVSGEAYSVLAGRYARLVVSLTSGWIAKDPDAVRAEDIAAHLAEISDDSRLFEPRSMFHEVEETFGRLSELGLVSTPSQAATHA